MEPYLINLDEDDFRSRRFMYVFAEVGKTTKFGPAGDVKPTSVAVLENHMAIKRIEGGLELIGGEGMTFHNGEIVGKDSTVSLSPGDRVVIANDLMIFEWKDKMPPQMVAVDDAISEYHSALRKAMSGGSNDAEMERMRQEFEKERKEWEEKNKANMEKSAANTKKLDQEAIERAKEVAMKQVRELDPAIKDMQQLLKLLCRAFLKIEVSLKAAVDQDTGEQDMAQVEVKMIITNEQSGERVIIDPYEFTNCLSMLKKEIVMFKAALKQGQARTINVEADPVTLLFDKSFLLGNAYIFPEFMAYGLGTDEAEKETEIHSTLAPFNKVRVPLIFAHAFVVAVAAAAPKLTQHSSLPPSLLTSASLSLFSLFSLWHTPVQ